MKVHSFEFVSDRREMSRLFAVLLIGLALLGHSFSQQESSGNGDVEDTFGDNEESGEGSLTICQQMRSDYSKDKAGFKPKCLPDGQFVSRQCRKGVCWCVDQQGEEIYDTKGVIDCDGYANPDITFEEPRETKPLEKNNTIDYPDILAGVIGGVVICLLCATLIVMFIVYRMKKKDEGSYILGRAERKNSRSVIYTKAVPRDQEFYA